MQNKPLITVIIPTYNRAGTLMTAIKSALDQSYPPLEILVCDDGSTDNSEQLVAALRNPKIKWINCGRNGRPAIPRNMGLKLAAGDWVAFLDNDDKWLPGKLQTQVNSVTASGNKAVCSNAHRVTGAEQSSLYLSYNVSMITFNDLLQSNYVICSSMMCEKRLLLGVGGFPEQEQFKAIEDYALWMKVAAISQIDYVSEPLLNYTDNPQQSIRANDVDHFRQRKIVFRDVKQWLESSKLLNWPELSAKVEGALKSDAISQSPVTKIKQVIKRILKR